MKMTDLDKSIELSKQIEDLYDDLFIEIINNMNILSVGMPCSATRAKNILSQIKELKEERNAIL